jgi:hypothetical protein
MQWNPPAIMQANHGEIVLAKYALTGIVAAIDYQAVLFRKTCEIARIGRISWVVSLAKSC